MRAKVDTHTSQSLAYFSEKNAVRHASKTSVYGQVERVKSQHAESGSYGSGTRGVFGQVVEGSLGRTGTDA